MLARVRPRPGDRGGLPCVGPHVDRGASTGKRRQGAGRGRGHHLLDPQSLGVHRRVSDADPTEWDHLGARGPAVSPLPEDRHAAARGRDAVSGRLWRMGVVAVLVGTSRGSARAEEAPPSSLEGFATVGPTLISGDPAMPEATSSFRRLGVVGELGAAYRSAYFIDPFLSLGYGSLAAG